MGWYWGRVQQKLLIKLNKYLPGLQININNSLKGNLQIPKFKMSLYSHITYFLLTPDQPPPGGLLCYWSLSQVLLHGSPPCRRGSRVATEHMSPVVAEHMCLVATELMSLAATEPMSLVATVWNVFWVTMPQSGLIFSQNWSPCI